MSSTVSALCLPKLERPYRVDLVPDPLPIDPIGKRCSGSGGICGAQKKRSRREANLQDHARLKTLAQENADTQRQIRVAAASPAIVYRGVPSQALYRVAAASWKRIFVPVSTATSGFKVHAISCSLPVFTREQTLKLKNVPTKSYLDLQKGHRSGTTQADTERQREFFDATANI